ncbi:MAG: phosphate ABC transporter substrate-binding protein [Anaerolineae bacterium]
MGRSHRLWHRWLVLLWLAATLACRPMPHSPPTIRLRLWTCAGLVPLAESLAKAYEVHTPHVRVEITVAAQAQSLEAVGTRRADVALLDRELEPEELADAETGRARLRVWTIGRDGLAVIVHPSNAVTGLSLDQLRKVFAGTERSWRELGGPDQTIQLVAREPNSSAAMTFARQALGYELLSGGAVVMPSDRDVVAYVAQHPNAIGYVSMAWVSSGVKAIAIDGLRPGPRGVASSRYPLTHPLALASRIGPADEVRAFVGFVLSPLGQAVLAEHHAPLAN